MDITITPARLSGTLQAIPSKSQAHRLLICAAFANMPTRLLCPATNQDIQATAQCLAALGADIRHDETGYRISPIAHLPHKATLDCGESGSTLRFLLPVVGALGVDATFVLHGRLPQRPLSPLWEQMEQGGCALSRPTENTIFCTGKLQSGEYTIPGNISSQYITGLLFALSLLDGTSQLVVTGKLESAPYVDMTLQAMRLFGIECKGNSFPGKQTYRSPGEVTVEGDWSNSAFFLVAKALGNPVVVEGLNSDSCQGDRAVEVLLSKMKNRCTVDASHIPDLVPVLAVYAAANNGAVFENIRRLRLKESDRVESVISMLAAFGIFSEATENTLTVHPGAFTGAIVDACGDHRIAMAAAVAASIASGPVTILGAQCTDKSYPSFWEEYRNLGGHYEFNLR